MEVTGKGANAPRKLEACKAKYAKPKKNYHKVQRTDKRTKSERGEGKTAPSNIMLCEVKHQQTNKRVQKKGERELK